VWFLFVCRIEDSLAIAGLLGIIWQKIYEAFGLINWDDRPLHKLTWDHAYAFRNWWYICVFTDSFSIFVPCVRVYCILCNLLLLFYYLTFQETIKNQLKGNYGGMMFNATCNNSPVISWQSVLLVDETAANGETHQPTSHWQTLSHNVVPNTPHMSGIGTRNELVVIVTDCIDSCKSNYHAITTTTAPKDNYENNNLRNNTGKYL
jgi:hypothetical protein